jgi:hypothetical protein
VSKGTVAFYRSEAAKTFTDLVRMADTLGCACRPIVSLNLGIDPYTYVWLVVLRRWNI